VARNLQGARLTIVGTYRDVEVDRTHALSGVLADLRRVQGFQRVPLRGLTVDEVQRMISNIRGQEVSWGRAEMYYRQTEGNPLFIQELLRYLVEEGLVVREGGRYALADPSQPEAGVPEGLRDVIGKRLSRLSPECNRLLSVAAVIGRDFDLATLRAVTAVEEEAMLSSLEEAVRVGVLEERSQPGRVLYRFAHAFFRQTLYEEMIAPRRLRLHQEIARALEAQYGSRRAEHAAELAEHFAQSTDKADLAKAVEYGEVAAKRAMSVFDYGEATRLLERAIGVQEVFDPDDKTKRCDLLLALGETLLPLGEPKRAADTIAPAAFALAEALGDKPRLARSSLLAINALEEYGGAPINGTSEYRQWASRLDTHALPDTLERVAADWSLARSALPFGGFRESAARRLRALEAARRLDDNQAVFEAVAVFFSYSPASSSGLALQLANEFAERPTQAVKSGTLSQVLTQCSTHFLAAGERERAEQLWRRVAEIAERTQDARSILTTIGHEVTLATLDGRLEEAIEAAERQRISRNDQMGILIGGNAAHRALVLLGRADEALDKFYGGTSLTADVQRARLLAYIGRTAEAQAALRRLWADFIERQGELDALGLPNLLSMIDTAVIVGDREVVALLVDRVAPYASHAFSQGALVAFVPARQLGAAAALLGRAEEARAYYLQALEACAKIRFRPEIALTRLQLAELLLDESAKPNPLDLRSSPPQPTTAVGARSPRPGADRETQEGEETSPLRGATLAAALRAEALDHLDFAISEFREMKMQPSLERALRHRSLLRA
ncbi:MAG TPA: hypothetical protein VI789_03835, partial [Dehalococcoidia bacterium]|nr:hypothetical protein [Dehalococcoidia bacterium]